MFEGVDRVGSGGGGPKKSFVAFGGSLSVEENAAWDWNSPPLMRQMPKVTTLFVFRFPYLFVAMFLVIVVEF